MIIPSYCLSKEPLPILKSRIYFPMSPNRSFMVLAFILSIYMIHLKLIFMYGVR